MLRSFVIVSTIWFSSWVFAQQGDPDLSRAANDQVAEIMKTFGGRGVMSDGSDPTPADEAVKRFDMRDGLEMQLMASEPAVSQPLFLSWDSRGRMWVVQYRQYQFPAGLKIVRYDQHLRAVFDKVPDPPPHGTPGADKITVHEDTDGDGIYDQHKDVITGLNIVSSVAIGRGGIWVLNPPYLLFYPDADRDDVPDGPPEVHLSGFGLQDTHSVSNSLMWGPDGWLYGVNGSTTIGDVSSAVTKGVRFQGQCVWRYHPGTKVFEIYAEGGGNTFSLDIDSKGRVFTGTNGGNTRGWYFPQGSYSNKNWGKHGPLTNPYAFGFFPPMKFEGDGRRFPQAFCIYEGGLLPAEYDGTIVAPNAMQNLIWNSPRSRDGSTYRTVDAANIAESPDRWFRPVYGGVGPDGAIYVADWYDTRLSHVSPIDDWHKDSGRVYRIVPKGKEAAYTIGDLHEHSDERLMRLFGHSNKWVRQRAALELGWRNNPRVIDTLAEQAMDGNLESLWTLAVMERLSTGLALKLMSNADPNLRRWAVRIMGDRHEGHSRMVRLAQTETDVQVRSQLASTAKRVSAKYGIAIVRQLLTHDEDDLDPHMPLMIWWAIEGHADQWTEIESMLSDADVWQLPPLFRKHIASRLMQRYAAAAGTEDLERCARLLDLAPDDDSRRQLMLGLNRAFEGQSVPPLPASLSKALDEYQAQLGDDGLVLALRQGKQESADQAIKLLSDRSADLGLQVAVAKVLGEVSHPKVIKTLINLATGRATNEPSLQRVAMRSLGQYDDDTIPTSLVKSFGSSISGEHGLRATASRTLASRPAWAKVLLAELNAWRVRVDQIPPDVRQQLRTYEQADIAAAVEQAFGKSLGIAAPEKVAEMKRLRQVVTEKAGNAAAGKEFYTKRCGVCHQLFGEGKKIGPPLDGYERGNVNFWLNSIVEPSLEIREGFQSYLALTDDGRAINGMIAAQDPKTVTLRNADNQTTVLTREEILELKALKVSLMPSDVLKEMTDQQIRDLFAYLSLGAKK